TGRAAVDRVCLRRAVDRGLSRGATGNVRMTSRQPPNDSVASHRFRTFRSKESFAPRCASDLLPLLLHGLTIQRSAALALRPIDAGHPSDMLERSAIGCYVYKAQISAWFACISV